MKKKRKKILIGFFILLLVLIVVFAYTKKEYIYIPAIKGVVYDTKTKQELKNIEVIGPGAFSPISSIKTNVKGEFFINGETYSYKPYTFNNKRYFLWKYTSYDIHLKKIGYKEKTIGINQFNYSKKYIDTIDVGIIYLEKDK